MNYYMSRRLAGTFEEMENRVRELLKGQGFGILTEIDVQATMEEKLGEKYPRYRILGACNPQLAHRALSIEPHVGVLLPCNVTIRELSDGEIEVAVMDPSGAMSLVNAKGMSDVARSAREKLSAVLDKI